MWSWLNIASSQAFGVIVNADCQGSPNSIFVPIKVINAVGAAQATGQPQNFSCTDQPGQQDFILTPADIQTVNTIIDGMNTHIQAVAQQNGWAYVDFATVWAQWVAARGPFSLSKLLTCTLPYGQYTSLDGVHPNSTGYQEMTNAAAAEYGLYSGLAWWIPGMALALLYSVFVYRHFKGKVA